MNLLRLPFLLLSVASLGACSPIKTMAGKPLGKSINPQLVNSQTGQALANTPYRLFLVQGTILATGTSSQRIDDQTLDGMTDGRGYTGEVYTDIPLGQNDYVLLEKVGQGKYGKYFVLRNTTGEVLRNTPYHMTFCSRTQTYDGVSNSLGYTAFVSTDKPCEADITVTGKTSGQKTP